MTLGIGGFKYMNHSLLNSFSFINLANSIGMEERRLLWKRNFFRFYNSPILKGSRVILLSFITSTSSFINSSVPTGNSFTKLLANDKCCKFCMHRSFNGSLVTRLLSNLNFSRYYSSDSSSGRLAMRLSLTSMILRLMESCDGCMAESSPQGKIRSTRWGLRPMRGGRRFLIELVATEAPCESMKSLVTPLSCLNCEPLMFEYLERAPETN